MTAEKLFDNYKCYVQLEEGPGEYLVDEEDFKKALLEFAEYNIIEAKNQILKEIQNNIEYLQTTELDEFECITIENLEGVLNKISHAKK